MEQEQQAAAIFLMGPTASGKTDLAMALCDRLPCDIISVDSALVYRGMDIGTAKPDANTLARYPHRLVDILDPSQVYSAANFRRDALEQMAEISAAGRIPLLVGGTMLYFKALLQGLGPLPEADQQLREEILREAETHGWDHVHRQLAEVDPESARRIHPNDPQRLQRALEVYRITGVSMTEWRRREQQNRSEALPYRFLQLAIAPHQRSVLHQRIAARFERMVDEGLLEEVRQLYNRGDLHADLPAIRAVGYRQIWDHLDGKLTLEQAIEKGVVATRQLAKRQFTWLRSWPDLHWLYTDSGDQVSGYQTKSLDVLSTEALNFLSPIII